MGLRDWPEDWEVGPVLTTAEIEAENLREDDGRVPHVPFGFGHDKWIAFKEKAQPGDTFHYFCSSARSWQNLAGRSGYVFVRGDRAVDTFVTVMN